MDQVQHTNSLEVVRVLDASPSEVYRAFHEHTWLRCGGPPFSWLCYLQEQGDPVTLVGQERVVSLLVHERILQVVPDESIVYTVCKNFPVKTHQGKVTFEASVESEGKTVLTWHVDYTPYRFLNFVIVVFVKMFFPIFLFTLAMDLKRRSKEA